MPFVLLYLVVEIVALVALTSAVGVGVTLLVLLGSAVVGLWLARREGARAARALAEAVTSRRVAHVELTDGMLIAVAGLLIFVPGLVTDVAGLLLLLPPVRAIVRRRLVRAAEERAPQLRTARIRATGDVVDGSVVDTPGPSGTAPGPGGAVLDRRGAAGGPGRRVGVETTILRGDRIDVTIVRGFGVPASGPRGPVVDGSVVDGSVVAGPVVDGSVVDGDVVESPVVGRGGPVAGSSGAAGPVVGGPSVGGRVVEGDVVDGSVVEGEAHRPAS